MTKYKLKQKTETVMNETKNALQIVYDELNHGQQQKLLKNEVVAALFERYKVDI